MYDVFLSYASADESAVEHLARKLRDAGITSFLDAWNLVPGEPVQEALEEALDQSRTCAVFVGQEILSPWQNEETRSALETRARDRSFRVIPILLPGSREPGNEALPRFLRRLVWVDFRAGLENENAFHCLLSGIRGLPPGPGDKGEKPAPPRQYRCMAPPRDTFVQRAEYAEVVKALCGGSPGSGTTVGITTALHGAGGFGKTAVAVEICYDAQVRSRFPDGILWTTLGEKIDEVGRLARVMDLIRWWAEGDPPTFQTVDAAGAHLRRLLGGRRVLLVVDDLWNPEDIPPFQGLGFGSALLVTSRDRAILPSEAIPVEVDAMEVSAAVRLLAVGLPPGMNRELERLAARLGEWPLLLKIVNRQLRELVQKGRLSLERALREVWEALDAEGLTVFDREDLDSRSQAVAHTLNASLRNLPAREVERFNQLGIFPKDREIPLSVLERLWRLGGVGVKKLCARLYNLSLLLRFDRHTGTIRLHDVVRDYLLTRGKAEIPALHQNLLASYRPADGRWSDLPRGESYLWRHLSHHLIGGGEVETVRELLCDFDFLRARLEATDVNALLMDTVPGEADEEPRIIQAALRLAAHVLIKDPSQLAGQLLGRLKNHGTEGIERLLRGALAWNGGTWLCPRTPSLTQPGGPLIRTLEGHTQGVMAVAMVDHRRIVSASFDGSLRVWDLESGSTLRSLERHTHVINGVAVLGTRRVVSASSDRNLLLWDLESGKVLRSLEGHSFGVNGVVNVDGSRVVSASSDRTLRVWDLDNGRTLHVLEGHTHGVNAVARVDIRHVVSGAGDMTVRIWDIDRGQSVQILEGHTSGVLAVAGLGRGRVASASYDETVRVWDAASGQTLHILEGHASGASAVASLDSRHVISGSIDGTLRLWDLRTGQIVEAIKAHPGSIMALAVLDDLRVVSASIDGTLRWWNLVDNKVRQPLDGHSDAIQALAPLDDRRMISVAMDGALRIWDVETGQCLGAPLQGHASGIYAVTALDSTLAVSASLDKTLRVWNLESGETLTVLRGHQRGVNAVAVLDSRQVVSASADGTLRVWDIWNGQTVSILEGHSGGIEGVAVLDLPEGKRVASVSDDGTLRVWDLSRERSLRVIGGASGGFGALVLLRDGRALSSSLDGTLLICDLSTGKIDRTLEGHTGLVHALAVIDERRVVSASADRTLRVWDLITGGMTCLFSLEAGVTAVAVVPGGGHLVAGDSLGRIHFFDLIEKGIS